MYNNTTMAINSQYMVSIGFRPEEGLDILKAASISRKLAHEIGLSPELVQYFRTCPTDPQSVMDEMHYRTGIPGKVEYMGIRHDQGSLELVPYKDDDNLCGMVAYCSLDNPLEPHQKQNVIKYMNGIVSGGRGGRIVI